MGAANRKQSQCQDALDSFQQALRLRPDYAEAYVNMGRVSNGQGESRKAFGTFQHGLRLKSADAEAYVSNSHIYCEKGQWEYARVSYLKKKKVSASVQTSSVLRGSGY